MKVPPSKRHQFLYLNLPRDSKVDVYALNVAAQGHRDQSQVDVDGLIYQSGETLGPAAKAVRFSAIRAASALREERISVLSLLRSSS